MIRGEHKKRERKDKNGITKMMVSPPQPAMQEISGFGHLQKSSKEIIILPFAFDFLCCKSKSKIRHPCKKIRKISWEKTCYRGLPHLQPRV